MLAHERVGADGLEVELQEAEICNYAVVLTRGGNTTAVMEEC